MATLAIATLNRWVDRLAKPKYSSGDPLRSPCTTCTNGFSSIIHRPWITTWNRWLNGDWCG